MRFFANFLEPTFFWLFAILLAAWSFLALWVQFEAPLRIILIAALAAGVICCIGFHFYMWKWAWGGLGLLAMVVGLWYSSLTPRQDRDWALELQHNVSAQEDGQFVSLKNIRDFRWKSEIQAEPNWIDRRYDLSKIQGVDMITSVWSSPKIAHLLVSFRFEDQEPVVFSAEIRREKTENFSEIGGFFRQFELALIAATEEDIIQLRTHYRGESVSLYPIDITAEQARALFLSYAELAQKLEANAQFYNTITANCTTVVWRLVKLFAPRMPLHIGLLLSGYLPDYLDSIGLLKGGDALNVKREKALLSVEDINAHIASGLSFSEAIRADR